MNAAYVSAFAALAGSVIGGLTTFAAAWVTQRQQANVQWFLQEKTRRQKLYHQFIEEASKLYVDALIHDQPAIPALVSLYASINKVKLITIVITLPASSAKVRQRFYLSEWEQVSAGFEDSPGLLDSASGKRRQLTESAAARLAEVPQGVQRASLHHGAQLWQGLVR